MIKGIIYNAYGEIAQRVTVPTVYDVYDWFKSHGVTGRAWTDTVIEGNLYYYHRT